MKAMCSFFGISRAAYYDWRTRLGGPDRDTERKQLVLEAYAASKKTYGYGELAYGSVRNGPSLSITRRSCG